VRIYSSCAGREDFDARSVEVVRRGRSDRVVWNAEIVDIKPP
jgi:hypothetical protein